MRTLAVLAVATMATLSVARMPQNSYLVRPVRSTAELVAQVKTDARVADRYVRHFGLSKTEVLTMLKGLTIQALPRDELHSVYIVPRSGSLKVDRRKLKKGERVFVDRAGQRVLMVVCGNPLIAGKAGAPVLVDATAVDEPSEFLRPVAEMPTIEPEMMLVETTTAPELIEAPIIAEAVPETLAPTPAMVPEVVAVPGTPIWPLLGLIGFIRGGGSSTAPVPEPATLAWVGLGTVLLLRRRKSG